MPSTHVIALTKQEQQWILARRVARLSDNKEVQIYPMGAERYLSSALFTPYSDRYNIQADIVGKDVLVIPGYGNSGFLFAQAGAKSVTVYDKDPVTIAWIKAFKKYYHYRGPAASEHYPSIGELLTALTKWYPPYLSLPTGQYINRLFWTISPNSLRRVYIHRMLWLVHQALGSKTRDCYELDKNIQFHAGTVETLTTKKDKLSFDTVFVPYLLGVRNGIERETEIVDFINALMQIYPKARILVNPSRNTKEFYCIGKRYFTTTNHKTIQDITALCPYVIEEDKYWFRTQGLTVLKFEKECVTN